MQESHIVVGVDIGASKHGDSLCTKLYHSFGNPKAVKIVEIYSLETIEGEVSLNYNLS